MRKLLFKLRFFFLFVLSLVAILCIFYFVDMRFPLRNCHAKWGFINTVNNKYYTEAEKITIRPWRGQHNVYAIFMIPKSYQYEYLFRLHLPSEQTYCGVIHRTHQSVVDGVVAKPGYYLLKGYLNTRIALNLMIQGKLNQLKQSHNWELGYVRKTRKSS
ncbi:hypothetical protein [Nostoc sp. CMAA1605]|uniref:hypothetical protein n=1 Tax=Nostoc sp. CMAA1605 TaxID=2055159 RepID=UPI001F19DB2E|nr:hypothetical protein [Nostoc sp. CMAA1605]MCF4969256.1 hypothetical protein [Nostoc sp. CMAA1605]